MPDTPRTLAELLTIFADNTSGAISPQDMRDFVVSVFNPDGGMFYVTRNETGGGHMEATYDLADGSAETTWVDNQALLVQLEPHANDNFASTYDPEGWLRATTLVSSYWGITFPAKTLLELGPGRYLWQCTAFYAKASGSPSLPADSSFVSINPDIVDDPAGHSDPISSFAYLVQDRIGQYAGLQDRVSASSARVSTGGFFQVGAGDSIAWFPYLTANVFAEAMRLTAFELSMRRD